MEPCPSDCVWRGDTDCPKPNQKCRQYTQNPIKKTIINRLKSTNCNVDLIMIQPPTPSDISKMIKKDINQKLDHSIKHDAGKPIAGCLEEFSHALEAMVEVFDAGRREGYTRGSWENVEPERYKDAEWRHRLAGKRELVDQKSGLPHKFHEIWNALAQLELSERKRLSGGDCNILDL